MELYPDDTDGSITPSIPEPARRESSPHQQLTTKRSREDDAELPVACEALTMTRRRVTPTTVFGGDMTSDILGEVPGESGGVGAPGESGGVGTEMGAAFEDEGNVAKRSSHVTMEDDELFRLSITLPMEYDNTTGSRRRTENIYTAAPDTNFQSSSAPACIPKSAELTALILEGLKSNFVFSDVSDDDIYSFMDHMTPLAVSSGTHIITQGDTTDIYLYVLVEGTVKFMVDGKTVGLGSPGTSFGEVALMYDSPRTASAVAETDCSVWKLERTTFRSVLATASVKRDNAMVASLRQMDMLKELDEFQIDRLANVVTLEQYGAHDHIIKKGEIGHTFYIIRSGSVACTHIEDGFPDRVLGEGDFFGEMALLTGGPRSANVYALTQVTLGAISQQDFDRVLGSMKGLLERNHNMRLLGSIPLFQSMTLSERSGLVQMMHVRSFPLETKIISQGDVGGTFYVIRSGTCRVQVSHEDCKKRILRTLTVGDFFGEMALLRDEPRSCDVVASSDVECFVLDRMGFSRVVGSGRGLVRHMLESAVEAHQVNDSVSSRSTLLDVSFDTLRAIKILGDGTFARILLVQDTLNENMYALKKITKASVTTRRQDRNIQNEKMNMLLCDHPFILKLHATFKDERYLYFLLEYCQGGELFSVIHTRSRDGIPEPCAKFYSICICMALEYLAFKDIAHRDIKPENILIDKTGYCKLIDLGFSKVIRRKSYTLCGTPAYLAPELVLGKGHDRSVDLWAFGVLIYEMIVGYPPFDPPDKKCSANEIFRSIVSQEVSYPSSLNSKVKNMIRKLLVRDPSNRLGMTEGAVHALWFQDWVQGINYEKFIQKSVRPPWIPDITDPADTRYFIPVVDQPHDTERISSRISAASRSSSGGGGLKTEESWYENF